MWSPAYFLALVDPRASWFSKWCLCSRPRRVLLEYLTGDTGGWQWRCESKRPLQVGHWFAVVGLACGPT